MNRVKYRVWLISVVIAAVIFGVIYYVYTEKQDKIVTDGTFVYRIERESEKGLAA